MATVSTRALSKKDNFDIVPIKVDGSDYKDKTGVIALTLTSYGWGTGSATSVDAGSLDIRVPQFNTDNDIPVLNEVALTTSMDAGITIGTKYFFAVNNGVPGPSVYINGDGTWDLMFVKYKQPENNALAATAATVVYSVAFTDLTPSVNPTDTGTFDISVSDENPITTATIAEPSSTFGVEGGRIIAQINEVDIVAIDMPPRFTDFRGNKVADIGDYPPILAVVPAFTEGGFAIPFTLILNATSKYSGVKIYDKRICVFAVNGGRIDGNGTNNNGVSAMAELLNIRLEKYLEFPCDDDVTATIHYTKTWTQMT